MEKKNKKIKVLMVGLEVAPFVKVGGLADVMGSLPPALLELGVDVRVIMPLFGRIDRKKYGLKKIYKNLEVPSGKQFRKINIFEGVLPGTEVKVYFIEEPEMFGSRRVYKMHGKDEARFLFFSLAALYAIPVLDFEPEILHCHDSHTGLIPDLIKVSNLDYIRSLKTLFTIHNFQYQGISEPYVLSIGNLHVDSLKSLTEDIKDGNVNFMAQGVLNADKINTVSETYAEEITSSMYGAGLERVIQKRKADLSGVLNGIDVEKFNPRTDKLIAQNYSEKSLTLKGQNKLALQKELGLPIKEDVPLCAMITRLVWQKGIELITEEFMKLGCQFVFLGTGAEVYEKQLLALQEKYPEFVSAQIRFSNDLAQKIYAGSDIFLMPSRFEPCGLGQMIAMRYGTVPVVRETGGLKDTVDKQVGFSFKKFESKDFYDALENAVDVYQHMPQTWQQLQVRGMKKDFSWDHSAKKYLKLYNDLLK